MKVLHHISLHVLAAGLAMLCVFLMGDVATKKIILLAPAPEDTAAYDPGQIFVLSMLKASDTSMTVATQWEIDTLIEVSSSAEQSNFPKTFFLLFGRNTTLQSMTYAFKVFSGYTVPDSIAFGYTDTMNIRALWSRPELTDLVKKVNGTEATALHLHLRGWRDGVYSTQFDDPTADDRALYKIQINLLPGVNELYFQPGGRMQEALSVTKRFQQDFVSIESRSWHFHNSDLEKNCVTCHDGLPSSTNGDSMTADCGSCHKAFSIAAYQHAPVEMNMCSSCHAWSKEKKMMTTAQAVPDMCYGCHDAKHAQIDSSAVPHPVAADCLGCHSPHATNTLHLLKNDVYDLCSSCHTGYGLNHPVGKHPVRFAKIRTHDDEVISCVSCHQPHGSANASLLATAGGRMMLCLNCHNK